MKLGTYRFQEETNEEESPFSSMERKETERLTGGKDEREIGTERKRKRRNNGGKKKKEL